MGKARVLVTETLIARPLEIDRTENEARRILPVLKGGSSAEDCGV